MAGPDQGLLDPATTKGGQRGVVFLPVRLVPKVRRFLAWKREHGESLEPDAPLFVSGQSRRLSPRAAQWRFAWWQRRAGFDRHYGFHQMRRSAVTNVYRQPGTSSWRKRFARHTSAPTTGVYTHPAADELWEGVRDLPC